MNRLRKLLQRRNELLAEMEGICAAAHDDGERSLNDAEQARYDACMAAVRDLNPQIEREQELAEMARNAGGTPVDPEPASDPAPRPTPLAAEPPATAGTPRILPNILDSGLPSSMAHPTFRERTRRPIPAVARDQYVFGTLGEQLQAVAAAEIGGPERVRAMNMLAEVQSRDMDASGASADSGSDGAFLVQRNFATPLLERAQEQSILYPMTRQIEIGVGFDGVELPFIDETSRADGSRFGGVLCYWSADADTVTAKKPKFGNQFLQLEELVGLAYATKKLIRDATALESIFGVAFASEMAHMIDDAIFEGSGAGRPLGIAASQNAARIAVAVGSQAASTVKFANIVDVYSRVHARSRMRPQCVWLINQDVEPQLFSMVIEGSSSGVFPAYMPPGGLSGSPYGTLMGKPVIAIEHASTVGTVGDIGLYDLSEYITISRGGVAFSSSMHVKFETRQMAYLWEAEMNGQPAWRSTLTPKEGSNTQSPYVTVATRSG